MRSSYAFLLMWVVLFFVGLYSVPTLNIFYLVTLSLFNALVLYITVWGVYGVTQRGVARKAFSVLLILILVGLAYQNSANMGSSLNESSVKNLFVSEGTYLSSMNFTSIATTGSSSSTTVGGSNGSNPLSGVTNFISSIFQSYPSFKPANPSFVDGKATIIYPQNYTVFANYALSLINNDRAKYGVARLVLGTVPSGQQHANSMLYFGYFGHPDNQGYDPSTRFKMLGGSGLMGENIGMDYCTSSPANVSEVYPTSCGIQSIENGIANSEWGMMYNDAICCNNGHRQNILDSQFTTVSIGIAYASGTSTVYFVEDFYGPCPAGYICS